MRAITKSQGLRLERVRARVQAVGVAERTEMQGTVPQARVIDEVRRAAVVVVDLDALPVLLVALDEHVVLRVGLVDVVALHVVKDNA